MITTMIQLKTLPLMCGGFSRSILTAATVLFAVQLQACSGWEPINSDFRAIPETKKNEDTSSIQVQLHWLMSACTETGPAISQRDYYKISKDCYSYKWGFGRFQTREVKFADVRRISLDKREASQWHGPLVFRVLLFAEDGGTLDYWDFKSQTEGEQFCRLMALVCPVGGGEIVDQKSVATTQPNSIVPAESTTAGAKLVITSEPTGAKVYIDNDFVATTTSGKPVQIPISKDRIMVRIQKNGFKRWEETVKTIKGAELPLHAELEKEEK
jgi:hypothetical protein